MSKITPNGVTYTRREFHTDDGEYNWYMDDTRTGEGSVPVVIYCHGHNGSPRVFWGQGAVEDIRNWLMDAGYAVLEGHGAGNNWGDDLGRAAYVEAFQQLRGMLSIGDVYVIGHSMGGLVSYRLAADSDIAHRVVGLLNISGTTDLIYRVTFRAEDGFPEILERYDCEDLDEFYASEYVARADPMQMPPHLWQGKAVVQLWGTEDGQVEAEHHAIPWLERYKHAARAYYDVREGGQHGSGNGSSYQVGALTSFFQWRGRPPITTQKVTTMDLRIPDGWLHLRPLPNVTDTAREENLILDPGFDTDYWAGQFGFARRLDQGTDGPPLTGAPDSALVVEPAESGSQVIVFGDEVQCQPGQVWRIAGYFRHTDGAPITGVTQSVAGGSAFLLYLGANGNTGGSGWLGWGNTVGATPAELTDQWEQFAVEVTIPEDDDGQTVGPISSIIPVLRTYHSDGLLAVDEVAFTRLS